jgi:TRAP-type transport system periplasmic protein
MEERVMGRMTTWGSAIVVVALLAGCAGADAPAAVDDVVAAPDKAGGSGGTIVLTMGTEGRPGRADAEQVLHFAEQVAERSEGRIRIEPVWSAAGDDSDADPADYPGWDQLVARAVVAGDLDLAIVPARAWDTEGVTSLRALTTPLLLTSEELVAEVVTSDLTAELLAGLEDVGVVGLGLPPESLRRLFAFGDPPASAASWAGAIVRAPRSATIYEFLDALGMEPDDLGGGPTDRFGDGVRDGTVVAAESSLPAGTLPGQVIALGGPPLFAKINTLVVNADVFGALTATDQQVVRESATATVAWAIETMPDESEDARAFCERSSVAAGIPTDELEQAAAKVEDELRDDPATAALIDAIGDLAADLGATPTSIEPCDPPDADEPTAGSDVDVDVEDEGVFPEGVYRVEHTTGSLVAAGIDRPTAADHAGVWTLRFDGGRLVGDDVNEHTGQRIEDEGIYCVEDDRVLLGFDEFGDPPTCGNFWSAAWEFDGEELRFRDVVSAIGDQELLEALFSGKPWRRIG